LKNPDCEALWRQGEDVFADLRLDEPNADAMLPALDAARAM